MKKARRVRLESLGWQVGSVAQFLDLDEVEAAVVELRLDLGRSIRERRQARRLTQAGVARSIGSSQSRVAKMEAADPSVSLDLMIRALLALGGAPPEIGAAIRRTTAKASRG